MNEAILKALIGSLGIKPEQIQALFGAISQAGKDFNDIKLLLADNLETQKQILEELKKRGKK